MVFNSKEDFLNKNEVRIFLISILKSINIPLDVENENIPLKELVTKFKKLNYT
jgi:hypothetical protein